MNDWIIGKQPLLEALRAGRQIEKICMAQGLQKGKMKEMLQQIQEKKITIQWVPRSKLDQLADGGNHQGIIAKIAPYRYVTLEDLFQKAQEKKELPFFILLDGIEDPYNLGAIIRSANGAGVHGIIIPKHRAVGLTSVVSKVSAGAIEYTPVAQVTNLNQTADELKERQVWLIGCDSTAKQSYHQVDYKISLALVIGSEGKGISKHMKKRCDYLVKLPMMGKVATLNASVAAAILMYKILDCKYAHK